MNKTLCVYDSEDTSFPFFKSIILNTPFIPSITETIRCRSTFVEMSKMRHYARKPVFGVFDKTRQTGLYSRRKSPEASSSGFNKMRDSTIRVAKTNGLIS